MTRQLADDFASAYIAVNCVAPGPVEIPLACQNSLEVPAPPRTAVAAGRSGTEDEVACTVSLLVSEEASFIAGVCIIYVNGGGAFMA